MDEDKEEKIFLCIQISIVLTGLGKEIIARGFFCNFTSIKEFGLKNLTAQ